MGKNMDNSEKDRLRYQIVQSLGVLSTSQTGWTKELNIISWNDRPEKFDLRDWDPDHEHMSKGATFTREEAEKIRDILDEYLRQEF